MHIIDLPFCCLPERLVSAVVTGSKLELPECFLGLPLLKIPTAIEAVVGIAQCFYVIRLFRTAPGTCSDLY